MVHAGELRHHGGALRRDFRQLPDPAGRLAVALSAAAVWAAPARAVRSRHRTLRGDHHGVARLERAFALVTAAQPIRDRMQAARVRDVDQALTQRTINEQEAAQLKEAAEAVAAAIAVDDFAPEELTGRGAAHEGDGSLPTLQATPQATADELPLRFPPAAAE